ncbi:MAG: hypothetical protein ACSHWW_05710 [Nonlabens sp.]|uniref:hypothetical protein n=1 Tax=Nonlabens sp. TaxID=1888209 RepID=UPI003EFA92D1
MNNATIAISRKENLYRSLMRKSFEIARKNREKSNAILEKAAQLKEEIMLLKSQSN